MGKMRILVIRCDFSTHLAVPMRESEANKYVEDWQAGRLPPIIGGKDDEGNQWAVKTDEIVLMHTTALEQGQQRQSPIPSVPQNPMRWGSGL